MSGGGGGEGEGKLPSVDHGRRTDEGRDKKITVIVVPMLALQLTHSVGNKTSTNTTKYSPLPTTQVYVPSWSGSTLLIWWVWGSPARAL